MIIFFTREGLADDMHQLLQNFQKIFNIITILGVAVKNASK